MNNNNYTDPVLAKIRDLLEKDCPQQLRGKFWIGEPVSVAKSDLPLCFINYKNQRVEDSASFEIETVAGVNITVCYDLTRDWNSLNKNSANHNALTRIMAGRDKNLNFLPDSIVGILMRNQDLGARMNLNLGAPLNMEYGYMERGEGIFTAELSLGLEVRVRELNDDLMA